MEYMTIHKQAVLKTLIGVAMNLNKTDEPPINAFDF